MAASIILRHVTNTLGAAGILTFVRATTPVLSPRTLAGGGERVDHHGGFRSQELGAERFQKRRRRRQRKKGSKLLLLLYGAMVEGAFHMVFPCRHAVRPYDMAGSSLSPRVDAVSQPVYVHEPHDQPALRVKGEALRETTP